MYGFQANQLVLFAAIYATSFASAISRSLATRTYRRRGSDRRGVTDHIAYGSTAGFAAVCILGIVSLGLGPEYFDSHAIAWVGIAAGIGALGEEQHTIMRSVLLGVLETLTKKKADEE